MHEASCQIKNFIVAWEFSVSLMNRRQFLCSSLLSCLPLGYSSVSYGAVLLREYIIGAQGRQAGEYGIGWTSPNIVSNDLPSERSFRIEEMSRIKLQGMGFRGHGYAYAPQRPNKVVAFARRPGVEAVVVDIEEQNVKPAFTCTQGFHLLGHGCFNADGTRLYTAESDYINGQGKIVVRDGETFKVLHVWDSGGIGPHEIKFMPDGKTLVVANGGLLTHPETGRKVHNLDTMQSNLCYLDVLSGECLEKVVVAESKASIRHIDIASDGSVAFAIQVQREAMSTNDLVPLVGVHRRGTDLVFLQNHEVLLTQMQDYVGSVAVSDTHRVVGATSPKGNVAIFWDMNTQNIAGYHMLFDVCGITTCDHGDTFVLSNSAGELRYLSATTLKEDKSRRIVNTAINWDNHLFAINQ